MHYQHAIIGLLSRMHVYGEHDRAIAEIQSLPKDDVLKVLIELQNESNPSVACDAAGMIVRLDPHRAVDLILPLLGHEEPNVRWCICGLLTNCGDHRATESLTKVLLNDPAPHVRLVAANALEQIKDPASLPALRHAADNDKGENREGRTVAEAARKAIERITLPPKRLWS